MRFLHHIFGSRLPSNGIFYTQLKSLLGTSPKNIEVYQEAFTHRSMNVTDAAGNKINYERLEFLGDTLLSSVVSAYLYKNYPEAQEGKLTKLRAKIVSREHLNHLGQKIGLMQLVQPTNPRANYGNNILGNLLEALIGALYVDQGYAPCEQFILHKVIGQHVDLEKLVNSILSYKSTLIEWAQKEKKSLRFDTQKADGLDPNVNYMTQLSIDNKPWVKAREASKKKAEEKAARRAYFKLGLHTN